ncbi:MAG TPA: thymidylate kinase [Thermoanaerobaculia bacterium]|jgi:dTMP kinase|nr:thymidylate kinase [Thermoanaerobaculia bacterium]
MLVALEGVDGAGKGTQLELVSGLLRQAGLTIEVISFPRYRQGLFGDTVARFLNGGFGDPSAVPPHFPALLFAGDRLEHRRELLELLERSDVVLADRYVASNAAYQAARLEGEERASFLAWLLRVEYEVFELPQPELQVYLRVEVGTAQRLVAGKKQRTYTSKRYDVFEDDARLQRTVAGIYEDFVADAFGGPWAAIDVCDASGTPLAADVISEAIAQRVLRQVQPRRANDGRV